MEVEAHGITVHLTAAEADKLFNLLTEYRKEKNDCGSKISFAADLQQAINNTFNPKRLQGIKQEFKEKHTR